MLIQLLILAGGLALILLGANWLVDGASSIAKKAGVSEFVIGLTIVGIGTSMPELVVSCTGALQGSSDIAIGNVIGSNIFNVMLILGISAVINPIVLRDINLIDFGVLILSSVLTFVFAFTLKRNVIDRAEGALLLVLYAAYTAYLLLA